MARFGLVQEDSIRKVGNDEISIDIEDPLGKLDFGERRFDAVKDLHDVARRLQDDQVSALEGFKMYNLDLEVEAQYNDLR